jgi:endonuclease YncB( thermonuclease family)
MGNCIPTRKPNLADITLDNVMDVTYDFTKAKVLGVYDGDTITIAAYYADAYRKFNLRIYGIDCAELKGGTEETKKQARMAKKYVTDTLLNRIVTVEILNNRLDMDGKKIHDKFGRLIGKVYDQQNCNIAGTLVNMGLAKEYYGGTKE